MKDEPKLTPQEAVSIAAYDARGRILQFAIDLEYTINIYVAEYFTKDQVKIEELFSLLLSRINFEHKYRAFLFLVEKYHHDFAKQNEGFSKEIKDLIEIRNMFAHWPVDFSKEALENYHANKIITYILIQNKDKKLIHRTPVSQDYINSLIKRFITINAKLRDLI